MWSPPARVHRWFARTKYAKWGGYVDQYLLFPLYARKALRSMSPDTLFVFCDQALGPWVPLVRSRPHVVHAHDLLALRSALGDIPENPTSFTGRMYQRFIRRGFRHARHFISVSRKTRDDLHRFGGVNALTSDVVYNGLNFPYRPMTVLESQEALRAAGITPSPDGVLLHVGGGQWYKNRSGVIAMYAHYVVHEAHPLPLWCIGPAPNADVQRELRKVGPGGRVEFLPNLPSSTLQAAYSHARAFLFPSLEEGFGWPLIEAQACGCPVITTDAPPMSEVAGDAAIYIPRLNFGEEIDVWASKAASALRDLLSESADARSRRTERGRAWAGNFDSDRSTQAYLAIYDKVLGHFSGQPGTAPAFDEGR